MSECSSHYKEMWAGAGSVQTNQPVAKGVRKISLIAPEFAERVKPGQFVMLRLLEGSDPVLGRPFAVYDVELETGRVDVIYAVVGKGTRRLAKLRVGDSVGLWGPLGNGWQAAARLNSAKKVVLVAGGVGHAPFYLEIKRILALPEESRPELTFVYGGRTRGRMSCVDEFQALGCDARFATEDGSLGTKGFVTELLPSLFPEDFDPRDGQILACGPGPMMRAVALWAQKRGIECWTSLESPMACGMGICYSCVVEWKQDDGTWDYRRTCVDGPVFDASRLNWNI